MTRGSVVVMVMVLLMTWDPRHLGNGGHVIVSTPVNVVMMMPLQFSERRKFLSRVIGGLGARPQTGTRGTIRASEERIVTANGE